MSKKKKRKPKKRTPAARKPLLDAPVRETERRNITISNREFTQSIETIVPGQEMLARTVNQLTARPGGLDVVRRQAELVEEYNRALVERGLALGRAALRKLDSIDMTAVIDAPTKNASEIPRAKIFDDPDYVAYLSGVSGADMFYHAIPCFTTGVVQINRDRYIQFEVKRLDVPGRVMDVWVHDYGVHSGIWSPGVSGTLRATFFEDQTVDLSTLEEGLTLFTDLYHALDPREDLNWTPADVRIWENVVVAYSRSAEAAFASRGTNNVQELGRIFLRYVALLNYFLMLNKPKAVRKPRKRPSEPSEREDDDVFAEAPKTAHAAPSEPSEAIPKQPERLVRKVGMITITSTKIPRESTEQSVRKYKVAVWKARGGVRRMKDGRLIPFRESIRRRRALVSEGGVIPQSVIQLTDNRAIKREGENRNANEPS